MEDPELSVFEPINTMIAGKTVEVVEADPYQTIVRFTDGTVWRIGAGPNLTVIGRGR